MMQASRYERVSFVEKGDPVLLEVTYDNETMVLGWEVGKDGVRLERAGCADGILHVIRKSEIERRERVQVPAEVAG